MSDESRSVNLDMLKTQQSAADTHLDEAIMNRAVAAKHLRQLIDPKFNPISCGILAALDALSARRNANPFLALQGWAASFPCDMLDAGLKRVLLSGSEPLRIWDQARALFGHQVTMSFDGDSREVVTRCNEEDGCVGVLGWPTVAGSGQWWPVLNETRFHDLRIVGAWPVMGAETPGVAVIGHGPLSISVGKSTLLMAHDDHHRLERIFTDMGFITRILGRARSLVLFEIPGRLPEDDGRLKAARTAGLDGLRVVGALPQHIRPEG